MTATDHNCAWREEAEHLRAELADTTEKLADTTEKLTDTTAKLEAVTNQLHTYERELLELKKRVMGRTTERSRTGSSTPASEPKPKRPKNDANAQKKRKKNRDRRKSLSTEHIEHQVKPEEHGLCPNCSEAELEPMPDDESSEYEYVPGRLIRRIHARETLRCPRCHHFVRAPAPARVVDGGLYGPGLIARTVVQKCADCVPLYRQVTGYRREGLFIARSTLVDLFHRAASLIEPIYNRMVELVPTSRVVYADETSLKMQRVKKLGFIWTFATELAVVYSFSPDRSGETPKRILGDSEGLLVVDGYTGYNHVTVPGRRVRAGCNSHSRRKFVDIDDDGAHKVIDLYKEVFAVEREAKNLGILRTPDHLALRDERSRPAMEAIKSWCDEHVDDYTPKSAMGKAIGYIRNQWEYLTRFLSHVEIDPHNNLSEALLRIIALGRKNYLFVGHEDAGQNVAMLCSVIATCALHGVNPQQYLADILIRVQHHPFTQLDDLLPHRWKELFADPLGANEN